MTQHAPDYSNAALGHPKTCRCHATGLIMIGQFNTACTARVATVPHPRNCQCAGTGRWLTPRSIRGMLYASYGPCPAPVVVAA
jgi:hypothetical protein